MPLSLLTLASGVSTALSAYDKLKYFLKKKVRPSRIAFRLRRSASNASLRSIGSIKSINPRLKARLAKSKTIKKKEDRKEAINNRPKTPFQAEETDEARNVIKKERKPLIARVPLLNARYKKGLERKVKQSEDDLVKFSKDAHSLLNQASKCFSQTRRGLLNGYAGARFIHTNSGLITSSQIIYYVNGHLYDKTIEVLEKCSLNGILDLETILDRKQINITSLVADKIMTVAYAIVLSYPSVTIFKHELGGITFAVGMEVDEETFQSLSYGDVCAVICLDNEFQSNVHYLRNTIYDKLQEKSQFVD